MTEFDKWIRGQNSLPAYPRYGTVDEDSAARDGWKAALQWIKRELHDARDGFEPDLGLHNLLRRELGKEYKEAE